MDKDVLKCLQRLHMKKTRKCTKGVWYHRVPLPTPMSMKKLTTKGKEPEKSQGKGVTAELLPLAILSFLNASATVETYWHLCLIILCFTLLFDKTITSLFVLMILSLIGVGFIITFQKYGCIIFWVLMFQVSYYRNINCSALKVKWITLLHCYVKLSIDF